MECHVVLTGAKVSAMYYSLLSGVFRQYTATLGRDWKIRIEQPFN